MKVILFAAAMLAASTTLVQAQSAPPAAPREPVVDDYYGTRITDDYRWMEDRWSPKFKAWLEGQNAYARRVLDRIPGRDELQRRIAAHTGAAAAVTRVSQAGGKVFYEKRDPGQDTYKLYVRDGAGGAERLLIDPDKGAAAGHHAALDYYAPSPDGSRVVYAVSMGGSENSVIHILDVGTGQESPETIDRTEDANPSWRPDGMGFYYNRFAKLGPDAKDTDKYLNSRALFHRVGTAPETDTPLIGTGVAGSLPVTEVDYPYVIAFAGSPWALAVISHGADPALTLYLAPLGPDGSLGAWSRVADVDDKIADFTIHGDKLYLLSYKDAPRRQVIALDARAPDIAKASIVVPQSERVVEGIGASSDGLYVNDLDGGLSRLRRYDFATGATSEAALPIQGALSGPAFDPTSPTVLFGETNWITAPAWFQLSRDRVSPVPIAPRWPEDTSAYVVEEVKYRSWDGTMVPLSIIHRKDIRLDGSNPVWLTGYGAYGAVQRPSFVVRFLTLLEDGGVYAVAHVRGGGEYGEDWHLAGKQATKPNTYKDLVAAAEYLHAHRYGSPATTAIEGRSAGGITVGMATTARPDLFRVVFNGVGDNNVLRSENGTDGPANSLEYGSTRTKAGFEALYAVDATQHVKPGVFYPAVLLTSGYNDPRVAPWQPGKMAAHLQAASSSKRPVLFLVDFDAGHGVGSTKSQRDRELADQLAFLYWQIGKPKNQPRP
jgi:prolyl oligopeptidase